MTTITLTKNTNITKTPNPVDIDFLTQKINDSTPGYGEAVPFGLFERNNENIIIAGANGILMYGTIYIDQLWVDENYRKQGMAKNILENVHEFARQQGCNMSTIQTMDFQHARHFYEKLGYVEDFTRPGYIHNSKCIFMKKML